MKKILAAVLAAVMCIALFAACGTAPAAAETPAAETPVPETAAAEIPGAPKYVFLFIGDGMSYPQIQSAADYLGALTDEDYFAAEPSLDDNGGAHSGRA